MRIKQKLPNVILSAHPKLAAFAIALALTLVIGTVIGMLNYNQAIAVGSNANLGGNGARMNHDHSANTANVNSGSNTAGQT